MLKMCKKCFEEKAIKCFVKNGDGYRSTCKDCKNKSRRTGNPIGNKGLFRSKAKYGRYYNKFRDEILERDEYKCTRCGVSGNLHIHHIVPWNVNEELRYDKNNVITLCCTCHASVEVKFPVNRSPWNKGKKGCFSQETIELWSKQRTGVCSWNKGVKGFRFGEKRKPHTEESKMKMSEKLKGKPWTEARRLAQINKKEVL